MYTLNNLPSKGPNIIAYFDSQLHIEFTFPVGYEFSGVGAKITKHGKIYDHEVIIGGGDNVFVTILTEDIIKNTPPNFNLVVYNSNISLFECKIIVAYENLADHNSTVSKFYLKSGEEINVRILLTENFSVG